ncbi:Lysophospholipase L1 [Prosthecobacter debontii]|uniref:Lysophospholipase L1 n=1 Tax=Prosthecobacter debontii TaxID=48467 RepID=A0A1T4Y2X2_9BACT|nr:GDSL-type esterase/lipase family protein [Prosthecobacter debontii]SKA96164.1 Lysophospholipase L1 [Prosthecobacter debontii]
MRFLIVLLSLLIPASLSWAEAPLRIVLAGDSTVAARTKTDKERPDLTGWGELLPVFMPRTTIINHARGGASSKSFRSLGLWDRVLAEKPDYVLIQFGHNDQPGKGERTTDPKGDYRDNLKRFIEEVRGVGGKPVLITSVARRTFEDGKLVSTLGPYVEAMKAVAAEMKVPVIDLHHTSFLFCSQMGEKFCLRYAPSATDRTHFNTEGARITARFVAEGLQQEVPALRPYLQLVPPPPEELPFDVNLETIHRGYDGETCWVHPRAGAIPGPTPSVVLTMQKLLLTGSDVFFALNEMRTDDLGKTWSEPKPHEETLGRRTKPDGTIIAACDFTPKWHAKSGKLLGTGHTVQYENNKVMHNPQRSTAYAVYDEKERTWSSWSTLDMPKAAKFFNSGAGCVQRFDLENGDILLPIYFKGDGDKYYNVTVLRCAFDGKTLKYIEQGNDLKLESGRGVYEPSLTRYQGRFYLTLRNDTAAYVTTSEDGLHYGPIQPWQFDDGSDLGNYNTQQHWVSHNQGLYLAYNRKGLNNDHIVRHRAPLVMAQVNPETLKVIRSTECILVPERGVRLGNFAVTEVNENETWVTVAEWMQNTPPNIIVPPDNAFGADNSVYVARIRWKK